jgi:hypothetical protein
MELPPLTKSNKLQALLSRANERIDSELPSWAKDKTDIDEPHRPKLLIEALLPIWKKSSTLIEEPIFTLQRIDKVDPNRPTDRKLKELPTLLKSKTENPPQPIFIWS